MEMKEELVPSCNSELTTGKQAYTFEVTTTQLCNMRCTYCFENIGGHLEDPRNLNDYIPNIIDKAKKMLEYPKFKEKYNGIHFAFWGGESSMNLKMIKAIMNEFIDNEDCTYFMYSNGLEVDTLLKYLNKLKKTHPSIVDKYSVQFSYDGKVVHDKTRFDIDGNITSDKIIKNLKLFHENGYKANIKSTIRHQDFKHMVEAWKDINTIDEYMRKEHQYTGIYYAPTIDEDHLVDDKYFEDFKQSIIDIAKLEYDRHKKGKGTLLSWFNGSKGQCSVGDSMGCLSVDGNYYVCHAGNYADAKTKSEFKISHITASDTQFLDDILATQKKISGIHENRIEKLDCQECSATNCPRCEVINYAKAEEQFGDDKTFAEKWTNYNIDLKGFCRYWKFFGLVDRALQDKISKNRHTLNAF